MHCRSHCSAMPPLGSATIVLLLYFINNNMESDVDLHYVQDMDMMLYSTQNESIYPLV